MNFDFRLLLLLLASIAAFQSVSFYFQRGKILLCLTYGGKEGGWRCEREEESRNSKSPFCWKGGRFLSPLPTTQLHLLENHDNITYI